MKRRSLRSLSDQRGVYGFCFFLENNKREIEGERGGGREREKERERDGGR